jgi:hypothetical protein
MRFFETLFAGAALVAAALALEINDFPSSIEPGKTYTITYSPADNTPTTFILRQGKNEDLSTVDTLTSMFLSLAPSRTALANLDRSHCHWR